MSKYIVDNREAISYVMFKYTGASRDQALAIVSKFEELVPALTKILGRKWRRPKRIERLRKEKVTR